jgi:hypothetical protein
MEAESSLSSGATRHHKHRFWGFISGCLPSKLTCQRHVVRMVVRPYRLNHGRDDLSRKARNFASREGTHLSKDEVLPRV